MLNEWKIRPLEEVYPFVFLDAIHYKIKEDGKYISKAFYTVLGVRVDGKKDIIGIWIGENETSKYWLTLLNEFNQAIQAVYPKAEIQRCIVHQIRNSLRFIGTANQKQFAKELKSVYQAFTKEEA